MPISLFVLASGSRSNAILLCADEIRIMIDSGLGTRSMAQALNEVGLRATDITAVLVTHEHTDHVRGLAALLERSHAAIFASEGTLAAVDYMIPGRCKATAMNGETVDIGGVSVRAIPVSHDAAEPLGYYLQVGSHRITVATDTGIVPEALAEALANSTCAVFESNHDKEMLLRGSYPEFLKERILSEVGHLSNAQCATALQECKGTDLRTVVLAHLSDENNDPALAQQSAEKALHGSGVTVHVTTRMAMGPFLNLE